MRAPRRQRGITLVLLAVAMLALIALAGLAIDIANVTQNQAQLQATVDAAAISAAKALDDTGSTTLATNAAMNVFAVNAAQNASLTANGTTPTIQFSNTMPFINGTTPPLYCRVRVGSGGSAPVSIPATLTTVLGFNSFNLAAQAEAGPSPTLSNACNITSMMLCGTAATPAAPVYGYYVGQIVALTLSSGAPQATLLNYLIESSGVESEDQDFAGGFTNCDNVGNTDTTYTGTATAPVAQGLDTRFDEYTVGDLNSAAYPPDVITTQPPIGDPNHLQCQDPTCQVVVNGAGTVITNSSQDPNYSYEGMYLPSAQAGDWNFPPAPGGIGVFNRRVLVVPVGDCAASTPAGGPVPVLGFACVFMLQDVDPTTGQVFVEVLQSCQVNGTPPPAPNNAPGPYSIQLYHVLHNRES